MRVPIVGDLDVDFDIIPTVGQNGTAFTVHLQGRDIQGRYVNLAQLHPLLDLTEFSRTIRPQ